MKTRTGRCGRRSGFTLLDILIAVAVLAVVVAIVVPSSTSSSDRLRLEAASWILTSDMEYAQVLSIANPNKPVVVRFDPPNNRYWLAYADTPATPLTRPDTGEPYLVEFGVDRAAAAEGVTVELFNASNNQIRFESHGGLADFTVTPQISLKMNSAISPSWHIKVSPTTGAVKETFEAAEN